MTNPFGYVDPIQRVHEREALRAMAHPPQPLPVQASQPVVSPLANLSQAEPEIFAAAGVPRYDNTAERMVIGAVLGGLLGWMFSKQREAHRQRKQQRLQELEKSLGVEEEQ